MKIDVYGAIFFDLYIFGDKPHESKIYEMPGGSGFNIAYLLYKLGYDVHFNSFLGDDFKGEYIYNIIPFKNIERKKEKTATFISKNDIPIAVERKINDSVFDKLEKKSNIAVITTELSKKELIKIEKLNYETIFFDIGPRPFISNDIFSNAIVFGTEKECEYRECDIIKMGIKGIKYKDKIFESNGSKAKYKTGLGDIFDAFFIHYYLKTNNIESSIIKAISKVEKVLDVPGPYNKINSLDKSKY
jgi:sugar/nucleoside kinase (ribokinase family)